MNVSAKIRWGWSGGERYLPMTLARSWLCQDERIDRWGNRARMLKEQVKLIGESQKGSKPKKR